jgi:thiol:disulfide interchange protein
MIERSPSARRCETIGARSGAVVWLVALVLGLLSPADGHAQLVRVRADAAPLLERDAVEAGSTVRGLVQVSLPEGFHVQSDEPRDPSLIPTQLFVSPPPGIEVTEVVYPAATEFVLPGYGQPLLVFEHTFLVGVEIRVADVSPPGAVRIPARVRYQACDDRACYAPANVEIEWAFHVVAAGAATTSAVRSSLFDSIAFGTGTPPAVEAVEAAATVTSPPVAQSGDELARLDRFVTRASTGGYLSTADFLTFVRNAESGIAERGFFEGRGLVAILLLVFVGGLALNLTPCVLPMIPINLAIIGAGATATSRRRGFLLGLTYGGAMAFVYGLLGLVVILTASTFGTINASPWFNLGIAILFAALALAMFDVLQIDFSRFSRAGAGPRSAYVLSFSMGAVAALLAGACVAPVVIHVIVFASSLYGSGTTIALALPFLLGVGMAVPWPLAGAGVASLPKPGPWMVWVRHAFGVLILGTGLYYGYLAYGLFADRWVDGEEVASSVEAMVKDGWHASLAEGLATAEREGKPVLIDMWATWCKNCLTMDRTTLVDPSVKEALAGYVKIKFQAERPDEPPADAVMRRFNAIGLPTYVILGAPTKSLGIGD